MTRSQTHPLRIISWNIENARPYLEPATGRSLDVVHANLSHPEILCLQEIRVRPADHELIDRMRRALPRHDCHFSLNRDARNGSYRGGRACGVATYIAKGESSIALKFDWDHEGRVVASSIPSRRAVLVNLYAVNGTGKAYWDPKIGLELGDRHMFKREWIKCLQLECERLQAAGLRLILIGDWNISRANIDVTPRLRTEAPHSLARALLNDTSIPRLDLVDAYRHLQPDARGYTWISRTRGLRDAARVDYALIDRSLVPNLTDAAILDAPNLRDKSDHAPLRITLS